MFSLFKHIIGYCFSNSYTISLFGTWTLYYIILIDYLIMAWIVE